MDKILHTIFGFIIVLALGGCAMFAPPANLDVRLTRTSAQGIYAVSMHPMADLVEVNQIHPWEIRVTSAAGVPVTGARISFDGGMPQHGHGLPTRPKVTEELGGGRYRLDGVKFSMTGWWEMKVKIQSEKGEDAVTFNTIIASPTSFHAAAGVK